MLGTEENQKTTDNANLDHAKVSTVLMIRMTPLG